MLLSHRPIEIADLVPAAICAALIAKYSGPFEPMAETVANQAVLVLLSGYPYAFKGDETEKLAYMRRMGSVFVKYPEWAGNAVLLPGTGLASKNKFLPTEAELTEALEAQVGKARFIAYSAKKHMAEGLRREAEKALDAKINKSTSAERAAFADKALAKFKPMNEEIEAA